MAVILCVALRVLAAFVPGNWVWGLDTAHILPLASVVALMIVASVALVPRLALPIDRARPGSCCRWAP